MDEDRGKEKERGKEKLFREVNSLTGTLMVGYEREKRRE